MASLAASGTLGFERQMPLFEGFVGQGDGASGEKLQLIHFEGAFLQAGFLGDGATQLPGAFRFEAGFKPEGLRYGEASVAPRSFARENSASER
jgi:hypothetical protein